VSRYAKPVNHKVSDCRIDRVVLDKQSNNRSVDGLEVSNVTKIEEIPRAAWCPYELECLADSHCCIQVTYVKELWRTKYMMVKSVLIYPVLHVPYIIYYILYTWSRVSGSKYIICCPIICPQRYTSYLNGVFVFQVYLWSRDSWVSNCCPQILRSWYPIILPNLFLIASS
jgi:hypothetical protein